MKVKTYTKEDIENAVHRLWDKDPEKIIKIAITETDTFVRIFENSPEGIYEALQYADSLSIDAGDYNPCDTWIYVYDTETIPGLGSFTTLLDSPIDIAETASILYEYWTAQELNKVFAGWGITFEEQEIAPCPFCGFNAIVPNDFYRSKTIKVRCPMCAAQGSPRQSDEDAIRAWNRRTTNAK